MCKNTYFLTYPQQNRNKHRLFIRIAPPCRNRTSAPPWHALRHTAAVSSAHSRCHARPQFRTHLIMPQAMPYHGLGHSDLRNGPFRILKRPISHCKMGRFGVQNGPFYNTLCINTLQYMEIIMVISTPRISELENLLHHRQLQRT